jgi:hypothetical protein
MADENDKPGFVSLPGVVLGAGAGVGTAALTGVYMGSKAKGALPKDLQDKISKDKKGFLDEVKGIREKATTEINNMNPEQFGKHIDSEIDAIRNAVTEKGAHETLDKARNAAVEEAAKTHKGIKARLDGMKAGKAGEEMNKLVHEAGKAHSAEQAGLKAVEEKFLGSAAKVEAKSALNTVVKQAEAGWHTRPFLGGSTMLKVGLGVVAALGTMALIHHSRKGSWQDRVSENQPQSSAPAR